MIVLGLTGSIGMGKSTAAAAFVRRGAVLWDADHAVHDLLGPRGRGVGPVGEQFSDAVCGVGADAYIDRRVLGTNVFKDPSALAALEAILHPLVRQQERAFLMAARNRGTHIAVLDIPLLFETGGENRCDVTAVVSAPAFIQRRRVLTRAGMTPEKLAGILARQMSDAEKRRRADYVIRTGLDRLASQRVVGRIVNELRGRQGRCWPRCWPPTKLVAAQAAG